MASHSPDESVNGAYPTISRTQSVPSNLNNNQIHAITGGIENTSASLNSHTSSVLLRDWQNTGSLNSQSSAALVREFDELPPPVVPVVAISDDSRRVSSGNYAYPVATFVRDLVRTGIDQFSLVVSSPILPGEQRRLNVEEDTVPLSVRSEADAGRIQNTALLRNAHNHHSEPAIAASMRSVEEMGVGGVEYYVVDGDLIELPRHENHPGDLIQDRIREAQSKCHTATQAPNRMRRSVKRISKFLKRGVRGSARNDSGGSLETWEPAPSALTDEPPVLAGSLNEANPPPLPSPSRKEKQQKKRGKKKSIFSWGRSDDTTSSNHSDDPQFRRSQQSESEDFLAPVNQFNAITGLESSLGPSSRTGYHSVARYEDPLSPPTAALSAASLNDHILLSEATSSATGLPGVSHGHRRVGSNSVMANYVGTEDQIMDSVLEAGVLAADVAAVIETEDYPYWKKDDGCMVTSALPRDADYKVDKGDTPDVESMLLRAAQETTVDLDSADLPPARILPRGKSDGGPVPLSRSCSADVQVYNDMLKVIMVAAPGVEKSWVARSLRGSQKRPRRRATLGVDVHSWTPSTKDANGVAVDLPIKFMIWDVQSPEVSEDMSNFGAHPATQSLFFSGQSLYLLVWDLACSNQRTFRIPPDYDPDDDDDENDDEEENDDVGVTEPLPNAFYLEEANRKADRFLLTDINRRVLSWVDMIAQRGENSAILPVVITHNEDMTEEEVTRRCAMLKNALVEHVIRLESNGPAPKLLSSAERDILSVDYVTGKGFDRLQDTIQAIASDDSRSVFDHVGTPVSKGAVMVMELIRRFKEGHKLILLDYLLGEIGDKMELKEVTDTLQFLSNIGEILYFGTAGDDVLSRYIVLSRKWLVSALSCILRNDLKRELEETRRFMNLQCIYSPQKFSENEIIRTLSAGSYICPLLSDKDAEMLWQSMSFMREAADHYSQVAETSTSTPTMFTFLEQLLVHTGVFLPLDVPSSSLEDRSEVFFVPSLLAQADPREVWTYKTKEAWMTTLCHSWLFRDGTPSHLMEDLTVTVLREIYKFSRTFKEAPVMGEPMVRSHTVPVRRVSMDEFLEEHDEQALGRVRIHQVACWNSSLIIKMGTVFADHESGEMRESFVEIFVSIVDQTAGHCVSSDAMRASMQRVVVSGKGQVGHHGHKLWQGGYKVVLNAVREILSTYANVDFQAICPECLARSNPLSASTWSWDSVYALAQSGSSVVRCMRGHRLDSNLICGTAADRKEAPVTETTNPLKGSKSVEEVLPSVVLVGLWDSDTKRIRTVGSGFVIDKKLGLIVTAGHVLFNMEGGSSFGVPYFGLSNAKVVIGVIPEKNDGSDDVRNENEHKAVWRYFGDLVADDIHYVDACVVRIKTRMESDVDNEGEGCAYQPERILAMDMMLEENLKPLKMTTKYELEESVRIVGFNQGGDGILEKGKHINRSADFAKGYVVRRFVSPPHDDDSSSDDSTSHNSFSPREEIVIICPTIQGHSGGPCVNDDGRVIGILSRADPFEKQRCYLVPCSEIKVLVSKAKKICSRQPVLASLKSF